MKKIFVSLLPFFILFFVSIPTFKNLARPGYFPMHDDMQAMRLLQMDKCIQDGQIPCRWVPDMGYGYGYPQFIYYSPLPYYSMEFFHLIGFPLFTSVKIVMALGFILAGFTMFILARSLWGTWGGYLSAVLYLYAPYRASDLYTRGAVAEFFGMIFLPLIFWAIYQFIKKQKNIYLIFLSLSYAGLLLSHNITTLAFTPLAIIWGLSLLFYYRHFRLLKYLVLSGLLGFGLAAFFILPVIFEKQYAHLETITAGYFNYLAHFVSLKQLFLSSFWGYGSSELGPWDDLSFYLGLFHWLLPLISLLLASYFYKQKKSISLIVFLLSLFLIGSAFMAHQKSSFIWNLLPLLSFFQFPWRFLVIATFIGSLAGGAVITYLRNKSTQMILTLTLSLLIILFNFNFFRPSQWVDITEEQKFSGVSWDRQMTISIFDYLPIFAQQPPGAPAPLFPEVLSGETAIKNYHKGSDWQSGEISVQSPNTTIQLPLFYFPGMIAKIDGQETKIDYANSLGLITITLPQGKHQIEARLHDTPIRSISDILTLASFIILFSWVIYEKNQA